MHKLEKIPDTITVTKARNIISDIARQLENDGGEVRLTNHGRTVAKIVRPDAVPAAGEQKGWAQEIRDLHASALRSSP